MKTEIVMIGTELLLGQIVDGNAAHIGRVMAEGGIPLYRKTTVGDNLQRIVQVLDEALERADAVLTSGGLGPTEDDLTREAIAQVYGVPLEQDPALVERLEAIFAMLGRPMTPNNLKQAAVPKGGRALPNPNGTAPGLLMDEPKGVVICMPGVPHELHAMLDEQAIPFLRDRFGISGTLKARVLKVCGVGESTVDDAIGDLIRDSVNPTVGVLASPDVVRIRIVARADSDAEAAALIAPMEQALRERLPGKILGTDEDTLEGVVDAQLRAKGWRLAVAETDSGGVIAQRMAMAASFAGGIVLPVASLPDANPATARALAERAMEATGLPADSLCAIGIAHNPLSHISFGFTRTPEAERAWEAQYPALDSRRQVRVGVGGLEQLRRCLGDR